MLVDGDRTPVAGDGLLLRGADQRALPVVPMRVRRAATTSSTRPRAGHRALAAAPRALRARVVRASTTRDGGLTLVLRDGPDLRFGGADRLAAKWAAAAAVLADNASAGAAYLDLRYPERPAAGGLEDPRRSAIRRPSTRRDPEQTAPSPVTPAPAPTTP